MDGGKVGWNKVRGAAWPLRVWIFDFKVRRQGVDKFLFLVIMINKIGVLIFFDSGVMKIVKSHGRSKIFP